MPLTSPDLIILNFPQIVIHYEATCYLPYHPAAVGCAYKCSLQRPSCSEGTAMLQCWYILISDATQNSTLNVAQQGVTFALVAGPAKLRCHEPSVSFDPELPTPSSLHADCCRKATLPFYHTSTEVTDTFPTSIIRGAKPWVLVPSFNAFLFP